MLTCGSSGLYSWCNTWGLGTHCSGMDLFWESHTLNGHLHMAGMDISTWVGMDMIFTWSELVTISIWTWSGSKDRLRSEGCYIWKAVLCCH